MKNSKILVVSLLCLTFIMTGCVKKDPDPDPPPSSGIDGYWDRGDIIIHISGSQGTFYQIISGRWKDALEQGFITMQTVKIRYLTKIEEGKWSGQTLWVKWSGSTTEGIKWSDTGEFKLSNDNSWLYITTTSPWSGSSQTGEYSRVYP